MNIKDCNKHFGRRTPKKNVLQMIFLFFEKITYKRSQWPFWHSYENLGKSALQFFRFFGFNITCRKQHEPGGSTLTDFFLKLWGWEDFLVAGLGPKRWHIQVRWIFRAPSSHARCLLLLCLKLILKPLSRAQNIFKSCFLVILLWPKLLVVVFASSCFPRH